MRPEHYLGVRMFRSKRNSRLPSRLTVVGTSGITLGVMAVVVVLNIMGGFESSFRDRLLAIRPHVLISRQWNQNEVETTDEEPSQLEKLINAKDSQTTVSPYLEAPALLVKGSNSAAVSVLAVNEVAWQRLAKSLSSGAAPYGEHLGKIVLGSHLSEELGLEVGDTVELLNPFEMDSLFVPIPVTRRFEVGGIFYSGLAEWDHNGVWGDLTTMENYFGFEKSRIPTALWAEPFDQSDRLKTWAVDQFSTMTPAPRVDTWKDQNKTIFQSMQLEQRAMFILLVVVIGVAALNIAIFLTMAVTERRRSIGILLAMGMSPRAVTRIFSYHGMRIGLIGVSLGVLLGLAFTWMIGNTSLIQIPDVYYDQNLPVRYRLGWMSLTVLCTFGIVYLASRIPARKAAKLDPISCLRISG